MPATHVYIGGARSRRQWPTRPPLTALHDAARLDAVAVRVNRSVVVTERRGFDMTTTPAAGATRNLSDRLAGVGVDVGSSVLLVNLKAMHLNGSHGVCTSYDEASGRFNVKLSPSGRPALSGQTVRVKPANLVIDGAVAEVPEEEWHEQDYDLGKLSPLRTA